MSADYYYFAPTGGRYQTVFRGTLPRRTASGARGVVITKRDRHLASVTMQRIVRSLYVSPIFDHIFHFLYFRFAYVANLTYTLIP